MTAITSMEQLVGEAEAAGLPISAVVLRQQAEDLERPQEELLAQMARRLEVMRQSAEEGTREDLRSASGLTGGEAFLMDRWSRSGQTLCGPTFTGALAGALAVAGLNAAMGRIVAAPTAGSCGILPGALFALAGQRDLSDQDLCRGLFCAAGVGMVVAQNATVAGAEGGCQAECGTASAMAAAALVELAGGTPAMAGHAVAMALKNLLGLVCDPVAGLVEIPCIKRNAGGVANAFAAAEMALAGIQSAIPADEVITAMKQVGDNLPRALKETAEGGLAATPTGCRLARQVFGKQPSVGTFL